ncbi:MAG TPA: hypothetical protein VG388_08010 [Solirubrobacteraceae bacterium]|nr:hypothetical protein [Solirubrobacteraceae bacterium]
MASPAPRPSGPSRASSTAGSRGENAGRCGRTCANAKKCAHLARSLRAQRGAVKALAAVPLPGALAWSKFCAAATAGGRREREGDVVATGGAWLSGTLAAKFAGVTVVAVLAAGAS